MVGSASGGGAAIGGLVLLLVIAAAYFLPLIVAILRKVPNVGSVAVVNFFLGWTFIGWVVAMAMACRSADRGVIVHQYGASASFVAPHQPVQSAGWFADPTRRHQLRYWDGTRWTENVSDGGVTSIDGPTSA